MQKSISILNYSTIKSTLPDEWNENLLITTDITDGWFVVRESVFFQLNLSWFESVSAPKPHHSCLQPLGAMRQLRPTFSVNDKLFENFLDRFSYLWIVKKEKKIYLDFVIDKLTNSIQNTISGDSFPTEVSRFTKADLKQVTKKNGWNFNWKQELDNNSREVYKLTINNNPNIIII